MAPATGVNSWMERDKMVQQAGSRHQALIDSARQFEAISTAVVHPCDRASLEGALAASEQGLIAPLLVGPAARIGETARAAGLDVTHLDIVDVPHSHAAAERAVALVHEGRVQALMKGALHTDEVLQAAVDRTRGLRTERRMSHVYAFDVPHYPKPLFITDAAINILPTLATKRDIVQNAIALCQALDIPQPRVALLSAVETVDAKLPSTLDAAALCKMAERGQIVGGLLDGPLAFDNAISPAAAAAKHLVSPVAGQADVLVAPDLEAGNMLGKQLVHLARARAAGLVLGARVPIMLTSRADDTLSRLTSAALAQRYVHHFRKTGP